MLLLIMSILQTTFPSLTQIVKLDLSKNKLKELPDNFGDLTRLKHLDLYRNQLQHLPLSFSKLKSLKWLDLKDNPLYPAIKEAAGQCLDSKQCQKCAKDIVQFYATLADKVEQEKLVREAQRLKAKVQNNQLKTKTNEKKKKAQKKKNNENVLPNKIVPIVKNVLEEKARPAQKCKVKSYSAFTFAKYVIFFALFLMIGLSISSAAGSTIAKSILMNIHNVWNDCLERLPSYLSRYGKNIEYILVECHNLISICTKHFIVYIEQMKVEESLYVNILNKIYVMYDSVMKKLDDFYKIYV